MHTLTARAVRASGVDPSLPLALDLGSVGVAGPDVPSAPPFASRTRLCVAESAGRRADATRPHGVTMAPPGRGDLLLTKGPLPLLALRLVSPVRPGPIRRLRLM